MATDQMEDDIEECLGTVIDTATFVGRGWKYDTVEIRFATEEEAASHVTKIFRIKKVNLLLMYKRRRSVRTRIKWYRR